jgi:cobalamin biosynthesis protein CobD/CbiB
VKSWVQLIFQPVIINVKASQMLNKDGQRKKAGMQAKEIIVGTLLGLAAILALTFIYWLLVKLVK